MQQPACRVEFLGPPGAGKTTLAATVTERLERDGHLTHEPARRVASMSRPLRVAVKTGIGIYQAVCNPVISLTQSRSLVGTDQETLADLVRVVFNWQFVSGLTRDRRAGLTIHDQGVFQALWSVGLHADGGWETVRSITLPERILPDLLVVVQTNPVVLSERLGNRSDGNERLDSEDDGTIKRAVEGVEHVRQLGVEYERAIGRPTVLTVDNTAPGPPDVLVERITAAIERQIRRAGFEHD